MKQRFILKTWLKNLFIVGIPTIISGIGVLISLINVSTLVRIALIILNVSLLVIFIGALIWYSKNDYKYNQDLKHIKNDLEASKEIIILYNQLFENWGKKIYEFAEAVKKNRVTNLSWDKIGYYDTICKSCSDMIKRYCNLQINNVSVNFVEYRLDDSGEAFIEMVSDSNSNSNKPKAYEKIQKLSESRYHYADLIKYNHKGIEVAVNNIEILKIFNTIDSGTDLSKYTQYIAIPIYCNQNRILGIFEVVAEYNYIIESEREELIKFARDKITPYTNSILLVDKIHKGLYATPEEV